MTEPTPVDEPEPRPITPTVNVHQAPDPNLVELVSQSDWFGYPLTLYMPWGIASGHLAPSREYYQHLVDKVSDKSDLPADVDPEWHEVIDKFAQQAFGQWVDIKPSERLEKVFYDGVNLTSALTLKNAMCWVNGFQTPIEHEFLRVRLTDVTAWSWGAFAS